MVEYHQVSIYSSKYVKELEVTPDYLLLGVMYSKNIPKSIEDGLRLCTKEDLDLINEIVQFCVKRGCK